MPDPVPTRNGWLLPVLLAVAVAAALGLGFLYVARPNAGELGAIRVVVVTDDHGSAAAGPANSAGRTIHVVVAEAPLVQTETVSPGTDYTGTVRYAAPYLTPPQVKLTAANSSARRYDVIGETELGFTWAARLRPDDFPDGGVPDADVVGKVLNNPAALAAVAVKAKFKPGLAFEDFTWQATGLRAPPSAIPPRPFEQTGTFATVVGRDGMVAYPIPYASPANVQLSGKSDRVIVTECTAEGFKWRNVGDNDFFYSGEVTWTARGVLGGKASTPHH